VVYVNLYGNCEKLKTAVINICLILFITAADVAI